MNRFCLIVLLVGTFLTSCSNKKTSKIPHAINSVSEHLAIPDTTVNKSSLFYDEKISRWKLNGRLYSGYALSLFPDGSVKEKFGLLKGRKHNEAIRWYADGHCKLIANYQYGKLHGDKKTWSSDSSHILISHLKYVAGKLHGEQKKWYTTGELFKRMNLNMGKEDGLQQAFRKNGGLYVNYEAKNGRIFGLKRAKLCYELNDEKISFND